MNSKQVQRRELWRQRIAEQEKSGRPVSVFCREQSLSEATFFAWRQRLKTQESPVSFALVETKAAAEPAPPVELIPQSSPPDLVAQITVDDQMRNLELAWPPGDIFSSPWFYV